MEPQFRETKSRQNFNAYGTLFFFLRPPPSLCPSLLLSCACVLPTSPTHHLSYSPSFSPLTAALMQCSSLVTALITSLCRRSSIRHSHSLTNRLRRSRTARHCSTLVCLGGGAGAREWHRGERLRWCRCTKAYCIVLIGQLTQSVNSIVGLAITIKEVCYG